MTDPAIEPPEANERTGSDVNTDENALIQHLAYTEGYINALVHTGTINDVHDILEDMRPVVRRLADTVRAQRDIIADLDGVQHDLANDLVERSEEHDELTRALKHTQAEYDLILERYERAMKRQVELEEEVADLRSSMRISKMVDDAQAPLSAAAALELSIDTSTAATDVAVEIAPAPAEPTLVSNPVHLIQEAEAPETPPEAKTEEETPATFEGAMFIDDPIAEAPETVAPVAVTKEVPVPTEALNVPDALTPASIVAEEPESVETPVSETGTPVTEEADPEEEDVVVTATFSDPLSPR